MVLVWTSDEDHAGRQQALTIARARYPDCRIWPRNADAWSGRIDQFEPAVAVVVCARFPAIAVAYRAQDVPVIPLPREAPASPFGDLQPAAEGLPSLSTLRPVPRRYTKRSA